MDIHKEDLHILVDLVDDKNNRLVYDLIRAVIDHSDREVVLEAYHTPAPNREEEIDRANHYFNNNDDLIDWEDSCLNMV